jgi:DNA repair protein RadA/Sms
VWFGEVSLSGEIRPVAHAGLRLREAAKLGFDLGFGPADGGTGVANLSYKGVATLPKFVDRILTTA